MTKFSLPLLLDTNVSVYSSQVIRQWPCPSPPYLSLTPRRNDIPFLASSHIFLHVIPRESSASTFPCYVRISAYICTTEKHRLASLKKTSIPGILNSTSVHIYIAVIPPPFLAPFLFFFFFSPSHLSSDASAKHSSSSLPPPLPPYATHFRNHTNYP